MTINIRGNLLLVSILSFSFSCEYSKEMLDQLKTLHDEFEAATTFNDQKEVAERVKNLMTVSKEEAFSEAFANLWLNTKTGKYHFRHGNVISKVEIPSLMVERMKEANDKGYGIEPLNKFFTNLLRSEAIQYLGGNLYNMQKHINLVCDYVCQTYVDPRLYNDAIEAGYSDEKAGELATTYETPISTHGLILGKKVVNPMYSVKEKMWILDEDGNKKLVDRQRTSTIDEETGSVFTEEYPNSFNEDWLFAPAIYSNGEKFQTGDDKNIYYYRVGKISTLPSWGSVNCNSNAQCVKGFHLGGHAYINSWESSHNVTLNCLVHPMMIGAISNSEHVMRCLEFYPVSINTREENNRQIYFESDYLKSTDAQWEAWKVEAARVFQLSVDADIENMAEALTEQNQFVSAIESL